jgi:outer membrane receptor protein involved in Fe transport
MRLSASIAFMVLGSSASAVSAQSPQPTPTPPAYAETVQVTATRIPEDVDDVPASVEVVSSDELRDRGATDLKSALALVAGVDIAPGGDSGPAASVPEFWGLKEFDAFLLVVDGVPWGGAFNPALGTLDLNDVERIEVQHGPAPVMYGATSFVGVIQIVRRAAGEKGGRLTASAGSYASGGVALATRIPTWLDFDSSVSADFNRRGFEDGRTSFKKTHVLWRNRRAWGDSVLRFDIDATWLRQEPASPTPRQGPVLTTLVPIDSNQNPAGAHLDENRLFVNLGYDRALEFATWSSTLAYTHSGQDQLRGFLTEVSSVFPNARGFGADIDTNDLYLDSHLAWSDRSKWKAVAGIDELFGKAEARGDEFDYGVDLDASNPPTVPAPGDARRIQDTRNFAGLYGNLEWTPASAWRFEAGLRFNRTSEERGEGEEEAETAGGAEDTRNDWRPSGGVGLTFTPWHRDSGRVSLFANWKTTFKPAAIDFNLAEEGEDEGAILEPETSNSYELGVKTELLDRVLRVELAGFLMDFKNLVIAQAVGGLPALTNAGSSRLKGVEVSASWRLRTRAFARASYSHHDARFRDYLTEFDGVPTQLAGKRLEMSPHDLAALALSWAPDRGVFASVEMSYVGGRFLNKRNTAPADAYATLGALLGYRHGRWEARFVGGNLTDRRDPVAESELGDAQYYRLFPRRFDVSTSVRF